MAVTAGRGRSEFGCSPAISPARARQPTQPGAGRSSTRTRFRPTACCSACYEVADHAPEQERRRAGGQRPRLHRAIPGDASAFVDETIPHGTLMEPGQVFEKTWRIKNTGQVTWKGRRLERQGPLTGRA